MAEDAVSENKAAVPGKAFDPKGKFQCQPVHGLDNRVLLFQMFFLHIPNPAT
jgi:hypothetical protein